MYWVFIHNERLSSPTKSRKIKFDLQNSKNYSYTKLSQTSNTKIPGYKMVNLLNKVENYLNKQSFHRAHYDQNLFIDPRPSWRPLSFAPMAVSNMIARGYHNLSKNHFGSFSGLHYRRMTPKCYVCNTKCNLCKV